jgi:hypothetical protein
MPITQSPSVVFCIVESPYAPFTKNDAMLAKVELARNEQYVNACMADAFARGETPFASHAIYTRKNDGVKVLDDTIPDERKKGMKAGFDVAGALFLASLDHAASICFVRAFYTDRGWTSGMADGMLDAGQRGQRTEKRFLGGEWSREYDADYTVTAEGRMLRYRNNDPEIPNV